MANKGTGTVWILTAEEYLSNISSLENSFVSCSTSTLDSNFSIGPSFVGRLQLDRVPRLTAANTNSLYASSSSVSIASPSSAYIESLVELHSLQDSAALIFITGLRCGAASGIAFRLPQSPTTRDNALTWLLDKLCQPSAAGLLTIINIQI
ncbi:hypothetical protein H0H92_004128 [Tricholoma furcatifolium]|nr:hypothetical protein H0H92_004128 [Tricholoma furcatifolium]